MQVYSLPPLLHRHHGKAEVVDLPKSHRRCWLLRELLADVIIFHTVTVFSISFVRYVYTYDRPKKEKDSDDEESSDEDEDEDKGKL